MKLLFVTGGVISGVGKGIITSSIGKILKQRGFDVSIIKIDPYINLDAGTMRPTEHGEVWVTDDGGEIDQDLGNYERFLDIDISRKNNITTGQVYQKILEKERSGEFLGKTVQFIPHVPREISRRIKNVAENHDITLIEIGGTIGDYENLPFLFAAKQLQREMGEKNVLLALVSYLPIPENVGEMKTKPTQHAIKMLNESGLYPNFVIGRSHEPMDDVRKRKIETYSNISSEYILSCPDVDNIYSVPLLLEKQTIGKKILHLFSIEEKKKPEWNEWNKKLDVMKNGKEVNIAVVGKYLDIGNYTLKDSYISVKEALIHAATHLNKKLNLDWIDSKRLESEDPKILEKYDGIVVPGGFGSSGVEGKINAIKHCRENQKPFLGLCYGMQLAIVEFARNVCGLNANTTEVDKEIEHPVIDILPSQEKNISENNYGGTMRLGAYGADLLPETRIYKSYKKYNRLEKDQKRLEKINKQRIGFFDSKENIILERHRHRYEVNPKYVKQLQEKGLIFSGKHIRFDGEELMEFMELPDHKCFIATQAHPEFKSRLEDPSPMFLEFLNSV